MPEGKLAVQFYLGKRENPEQTKLQGRPIYEDVEYIKIRVPGDALSLVDRAVREQDKIEHAGAYAAFKAGREAPVTGTPLNVIPFLTPAQVAEFNGVGCTTAEQVRDMPDSVAQRYMGINTIRNKITAYLAAAEGAAPMLKLQSELAQRDNEIDVLRKQVKEQGDKIEQLLKRK